PRGVTAPAEPPPRNGPPRRLPPACLLPGGGHAAPLTAPHRPAEPIPDALLPMATIATPNLFELSWLTGSDLRDPAQVVACARQLGPPAVVVTSARQTSSVVATLLIGPDKPIEREMRKREAVPNGAGDLFAGLFL